MVKQYHCFVVFFFLFPTWIGAQFVSDYDLKLVFTSDDQLCCLSENTENESVAFIVCSADKSAIIRFGFKTEAINILSSLDFKARCLTADPQTGRFYILDNNGEISISEPVNDKRHKLKLLANRGLIFNEMKFNKSGNLLALIGRHRSEDQYKLMTFDFKYDNLNEHFEGSNVYSNLNWSGSSGLISVTHLNIPVFTSDIRIFDWSGKHIIDIHSDTIRLSQAVWGNSSSRFVCVGQSATGYSLLKFKNDGQLTELIIKSNDPILEPFFADTNRKLFFFTKNSEQRMQLWYIDLEL
ncbi:hypothetical protein MASR2M12_03370 [Bacteroidales bacterium]